MNAPVTAPTDAAVRHALAAESGGVLYHGSDDPGWAGWAGLVPPNSDMVYLARRDVAAAYAKAALLTVNVADLAAWTLHADENWLYEKLAAEHGIDPNASEDAQDEAWDRFYEHLDACPDALDDPAAVLASWREAGSVAVRVTREGAPGVPFREAS